MAVAALLFPVKDGLIKSLTGIVSPLEATVIYFFIQGCIASIILFLINRKNKSFKADKQKILLFVLRSCFLLASIFLFFTGVQKAGLAISVILFSTQSLFAILLSNLILRESISFKIWILALFGFAGVIIVINPAVDSSMDLNLLYPFCSAVIFSLYIICTKYVENLYSPVHFLLFDGVIGTLISLPILLISYTITQSPFTIYTLPSQSIIVLITAGVIGTISAIMIICSLKLAPASIVSPLGYLEIVSASIIGVLIFDEPATRNMIVGSFFIILSSFLITRAGAGVANTSKHFQD